MCTIEINNDMELGLYCKLLSLAYDVQKAQTGGIVSGTGAEEIRDKMYIAIKESNVLKVAKV